MKYNTTKFLINKKITFKRNKEKFYKNFTIFGKMDFH